VRAGLGDYTVKTVWGRAFYVVWHQPALVAANLLFTTIALILLKWFNSRLFAIVERIARKTLSVYSSTSSSSSLARPRRRWLRRRTAAGTTASEPAD
jgi:Na+/H+-dicarboxylate symporter